ncbi:hypothetical protein K1719_006440 [Acacia pycnantha]|nr:hypothetical protein K1719_006440 [Acacia pycnantha]
MKIEETVKLIAEGFEFVVDREAAMDRGDGQARMEPPANENGEATTKQRQSSINQNLLDNRNGNDHDSLLLLLLLLLWSLPYPLSSLPCPCSPSSLPSSQSSFRSSRAPLHRKRDKILQSTGRGREVTVTNDGATILKSLHIDNPAPAAKVLGFPNGS